MGSLAGRTAAARGVSISLPVFFAAVPARCSRTLFMSVSAATDGPATTPLATPPIAAPAGSLRELLRVAVPLVLSSGSLSLMHVIDRIFLTWLSPNALAAASPAGLLHWTVMSLAIGTAGCVTTFVAQYDGAKQPHKASAAMWQGVYVSLFAGVLFLAVVPFSASIFAWAGHAPPVQVLEVEYFSVLCYGAVPMTLCTALAGFFSGRGRTLTVLGVNLLLAVSNLGLDWLLIFGHGPFPRLGVRGAALATVIAYLLAGAAYFVMLARREERTVYAVWKHARPDRALLGRLLRYGLPNGGQLLADVASFTLFMFLLGRLGPLQQQATNMAFNLNGLAFIPLMGLGTAVMSLVGRRIGEGRPQLAVRTTWLAFGLSASWMGLFAAVYLLAPDLVLSPYLRGVPADQVGPLRSATTNLLVFVSIFGMFDAMVTVFSGAIRGAGDTRFPFVLLMFTGWVLMALPVIVADSLGRNTLWFSWTVCSVSIAAAGCGMLWRFQQGHWQSLRVIEGDPSPHGGGMPIVPGSLPAPAAEPLLEPAGV